jgi:uncharacterized C2H2 Zn-finger protein
MINKLKYILSKRIDKNLHNEKCNCDSYWENRKNSTFLNTNFTRLKKLRDNQTDILRCNKCDNLFYKHKTVINKLNDKNIDLLNRWNSTEQIIDSNYFGLLKEIGIIEGWYNTILIPCKVLTKEKKELDFCLLVLSDLPPFQEIYSNNYDNVFMINEIVDIYKSDYSLPLEIRKSTRNQREAGMGFTPTVLESPNGKLFCLNGSNDFLKYDNVNPNELLIKEFSQDKYQNDYILYSLKEKLNYIICDKNTQIENYKAEQ